MSTTIDERVVEMRFDNKHFENNVQTSLGTLDKLKKSLNLSGASKGLENVGAAAKNVNMSGLGSAVETVQAKFSALQVMGVTALSNITNSAVNAGKRIVSALTVDPVKAGFSEYETKINAIQTIMSNTASKGTTMEDVTRVIGELNTYADKTIYNFAEMTRNIGTFTAAGVGLEESATAIQGIANLAAASGSSSQQASTAMYQLSQALSTGTVKLMDWNSVVNAGMGGEKFQEALKATAREHGVAVDDLIEKNGSFRESLQEGWLSAEILSTTLQKFTTGGAKEYAKSMIDAGKWTQAEADALLAEAQAMEDAATKVKTFTQLWDTLKESAQSGWSQTWEIIVGDFEEAKETLTKFSDVIGDMINASAEARNELLQGWKDAGGRADLIDSLFNAFEGIMSIIKPIKEAFREIFPPITVQQLVGFTESLKNLTAKFKLSETASNNLKRTFKGLFAILDIIKMAFSAVFNAIKPIFGGIDDLGGGILGITASFGDWLVKLRDTIKTSNIFNKVLQGIVKIVTFVVDAVKKLFNVIKDKFVFPGLEVLHSFLERIHARMTSVGEAADGMRSGVATAIDAMGSALANCDFFKLLTTLWNGVKTICSGIIKAFGALTGGIAEKIGGGDFKGVIDIINSIITGGIGVGLIKFLKSLTEPLEGLQGLIEGVTGILDGVRGCFEAYQTQLKANALLKIAGAIAILAAAILVISFIDSEKLSASLGAVTVLFADLMASMGIFTKISGNFGGVTKACVAMISLSIAVLILASALKKISGLEMDEVAAGLVGVIGLTATMVAAVKIMGSGGKTAIKGATQMVIFAAAIKILASVCKDLSSLGWEELAKGLVGVGVLLAEVSLFLKTAKLSAKSVLTATGIVILASAIKILASSCRDFALMSWEEIGKGLAAVGALLAEVAIFTNLTGHAKHVISTGVALIAIAAAMKIFVSAMSGLANMSWEELGKGLVGMAGALLAVTAAVNLMPKNMVGKGVGLIAVATALIIMSNVLGKMGGMSWESIAKGLVTLGGAMLILAVGLNAMKGTLAGSAALIAAVSALTVLTPILAILGAMSWESIAKGLITIAGAFTIIGVAGLLLKPLIVPIIALAGALALIGVGILALGAGVLTAGIGLSALAVGFTALCASVAVGASSLVAGLTVIILGIIDLIPAILTEIGKGILAFCRVIADGAPAIGEAVKAVVLSLVDVLVECVPAIAEGALQLVVGVMTALVEYTPQIVDLLFQFLIGVLEGVAQNLPGLIQAAVDVLMAFFSGVVEALGSIDVSVLIQGIAGVGLMSGLMIALAAVAALTPAAMIGVLGMGAVVTELAIVLAAIGALSQIPGLEWLISEGGNFLQTVGTAIGQFIGGIIGGVAQGFTSSLPQIGTDLSAFMSNVQPFIEGAKAIDPAALEGVKSLVGIILAITAANIIEGIASWITGGSSVTQFATDIVALGVGLKGFSDSVSGINPENVTAAANAAKVLADMTSHIPNEGGLVAWFTGDNSIAKFGNEIVSLGTGIKGFSDAIVGINPENIVAAANAAKSLAQMTSYIPNSGGVAAWFAGDNSISQFSTDLVTLGFGLKGFSDAIVGINPENLTAAANAAKSLAQMTSYIPNEGGLVAWFTGETSISRFSTDLVTLGFGLKGFSDAIVGINPENLTAAANAAQALAQMTSYIPNEGGIAAWFTGETSISKFSAELINLGAGLKGFSDAIVGINPENLTAASNAAKSIAEMTANIPNQGGVAAWFTGEASISKFSTDLVSLGKGLKGFSDAIAGINPENVTAAANAAKSLAQMASVIPAEGGIKAWFTGENSVSKFAGHLPKLGEGLKGFSTSVAGINPENVTAAANAAKSLAQMADTAPENTSNIVSFGENLKKFGTHLKTYFTNTSGISDTAISASKKAVDAVKNVSTIDSGKVSSAVTAVNKLIDMMRGMASIKGDAASGFSKAMSTLGKTSVDAFVKAFDKLDSEMGDIGKSAIEAFSKAVKSANSQIKTAGQNAMTKFIEGIDAKSKNVSTAFKNTVQDGIDAARDKYQSFYNAGSYLVSGFASGISENDYKAAAKARAMAKAAAKAAEDALDINSPSKVGYGIGNYFGLGFINALGDYVDKSYDSSYAMADSARNGLVQAISRIKDYIDSDIDAQPTIRPVLDLSDVESGADSISRMFGTGSSVDVLSNVGAISTMMNRRNQNGKSDEVVSAIDKLRKDLGNIGGTTYNIDGITYDDGSNVSNAVSDLVRAIRIERRT